MDGRTNRVSHDQDRDQDQDHVRVHGQHRHAGGIVSTVRRAARFGAGLLRAIAGAPAGVERTRRGSFLVLVVATLALMSVFAVVYVTIGKTDAGTKRGVEKGEARDEVPKQLADHVAKVIGDDVFATLNLGVDTKGQPLNIREASDIPGVNWAMRSDSTSPSDGFEPVGTYTGQWTGSGSDPRGASDPFLASTEPTYLGFTDPGTTRVDYTKLRDWAAISNVAPDGRFVNLFYLRGNFGVAPEDMRDSLTLLDDNGAPTKQLDFGGALDRNFPAHFTNRQRGLYRPANTIVGGAPQSPDDDDYLDYHYADTDGDGIFDARWFEMTDSRDSSNIKNLLKTDDGLRYFFAVRVEDLSARANVLTGMDMKGPPTNDPDNVIGLVPEVDLRRVLSLIDPLSDDPSNTDLQLGYAGLQQPLNDTQNKSVENYSAYLADLNGGMSMLVGQHAYHGLHSLDLPRQGAMHTGLILPPAVQMTNYTPFSYAEPSDRTDLYNEQLGLGRGIGTGSGFTLGPITSIEDLGELLTYRGINDPSVTSQLELLFGGQYRNQNQSKDPDRQTVRFSPLRDNRSLALERDVDNLDALLNKNAPDGRLDSDAMLRSVFDVRQLLTTYSGSRPIMATRVTQPMSQDQITGADLRAPLSTSPQALFSTYAGALIPDGAMDGTWRNDASAAFNSVRFSNYGAVSAEFGARAAAHLAVNASVALQGGNNARAYTVLLDEAARPDLNQDWQDKAAGEPKQIGARNSKWSWWVDRGTSTGGLDIGIDWTEPANASKRDLSTLGDSASGDKLESKAINVYGLTPQPVLTAAASFYVYTDIPTKSTPADYGKAGDKEWDETGDVDDPFDYNNVTINGDVVESNEDFVMQVLAFQLTNPFNSTIYLTSNGVGEAQTLLLQDRFEYYIEFAGRFFRLANFNVDNPDAPFTAATLGAGETRVFYAMCLPLETASGKDIVSRWKAAKSTFTTADVKEWLNTQMSVALGSGSKLPSLVEEFDPITAARLKSGSFVDLVEKKASSKSLDPTVGSVRLWRALRAASDQTGPLNEDPKDLQKDSLPTPQYLENDQLVDRLRDPGFASGTSTLDQKLVLTGTSLAEIPGTEGGPDNIASEDPKDNTGFSITRYGVIKRNADPDGSSAGTFEPKTDGVPAYMLEPRWSSGKLRNVTVSGPANATINGDTFKDSNIDGHGYDSVLSLWGSEKGTPLLPYALLTTEPRKWEKDDLGDNLSGKPFVDVRTQIVTGLRASTVRVSDLLLPLAIGAEYDPHAANFDDRHLTLGEALANALDYSSPSSAASMFFRVGATPVGKSVLPSSQYPKLDRGHLAIDRFVPFVDSNNNGVYERDVPGDVLRGQGVPMALTLFDRVEGLNSTPWGVDRPVLGRVNVNTASRTVLRSVGVLSPTPSTVSGDWWWTNLDNKSDVATTILAYRDKLMYWPRASSPAASGSSVDFRDNDGSPIKPDDFDKANGRFNATGVDFLREGNGLASVGEVMLARALDPSQPLENNPWHKNPNNIDFMGHNDADDYKAGVSSGDQSRMKDPFGERLQIAASAMNALSTRSDYFAVWFVVRGYRESDVKGLSASDPMIASVQRRFVMVIDRSNVVKYGQKPRILLMKEVPF